MILDKFPYQPSQRPNKHKVEDLWYLLNNSEEYKYTDFIFLKTVLNTFSFQLFSFAISNLLNSQYISKTRILIASFEDTVCVWRIMSKFMLVCEEKEKLKMLIFPL